MSTPLISLVCPTRDRVQFVSKFIEFAAQLDSNYFEVLVSDNSVSTENQTAIRELCKKFGLKYIRPPRPLPLMSHWEFALSNASGYYAGIMTDKMYPLASVLSSVVELLQDKSPDVVSWSANTYFPLDQDNVFGPGYYVRNETPQQPIKDFDSKQEIQRRISGSINRRNFKQVDYGRGKICYGLYSNKLINECNTKFGTLFAGLTPDYGPLSLALELARSSVEIPIPSIVQINSSVSNGNDMDTSDAQALSYITNNSDVNKTLELLPIPGLYSSLSNLILYEYLVHSRLADQPIDVQWENWIPQMMDDFTGRPRIWSSELVQTQQIDLICKFIEKLKVQQQLKQEIDLQIFREAAMNTQQLSQRREFESIRKVIPSILLRGYRAVRSGFENSLLNNLNETCETTLRQYKRNPPLT
jgi:hypothetical protein